MPWPRGPRPQRNRVDWNVSLGASGARVADGMYPAKFTFNVNDTPDCTKDFVVFALNVGSSSTQTGIVAFNNLYTAYPAGGLCGFAPTVKWAYNTTPGGITTSPVLSLDGTKVAYMENSSPPAFHVLTIGTTGNNGTITAPATPGVGNNAVDVSVALGAAPSDKGSPVFVVYDAPSLTSGTQNRNVLPCSGWLSTVISPPCAMTIARAIARPIPVPLPTLALFLPR